MIDKIECEIILCDNCKVHYTDYNGFAIFIDASNANPEDNGWYVSEGVHYCPDCHTITDDDVLHINSHRRKA